MRAGWPADSQQRPEGLSVQVHPPGAGGRQHAEDQQDQQLRQRALQRARRSRRRPRLGPRHRRLGATADSRRIEGQRVQPRPLGAQAALGVLAGEEPHLVALAGRRSPRNAEICRKTSSPPVFGRMKPKPLSSYQRLIMPGFSISTRSLPVSRCILATRGGQAKKRGSRRAFAWFPGLTFRRRCSSRSGGIARSPGSAGRRRSDTRRKPRSCGCR